MQGVFDPQPYLVGDAVELRPLVESDFDELYSVASDPLIWEQHPVPDRYEEQGIRQPHANRRRRIA